MLTLFEPIQDCDLDHQAEQDRVREMLHPPLVGSLWSLGASGRDWVVVDTQSYYSDSQNPAFEQVAIAFVAPLDGKILSRSDWDGYKLVEDYPNVFRYVYLSPDHANLQSGWRVGGEVDMGALKIYQVSEEGQLCVSDSSWIASMAHSYYPVESACYPKVVIVECSKATSMAHA